MFAVDICFQHRT